MRFEDIKWKGYTYDTVRKGCWEGKARLEDMDIDGVDAEFIYPSQRTMFSFMGNPDREFHRAGVRAYNDYMAQEFCAADPERLFFLAQMPNLGVEEAIAEMRAARRWARAARSSRVAVGQRRRHQRGRRVLRGRGGHGDARQHPHQHPAQAQPVSP